MSSGTGPRVDAVRKSKLLDRPPEPVIGPATGRTRWRAMTLPGIDRQEQNTGFVATGRPRTILILKWSKLVLKVIQICSTVYYKEEIIFMSGNVELSDPISLRLPVDTLAAIEQVAKATDRTRSWVIVRALRRYLLTEGAQILD